MSTANPAMSQNAALTAANATATEENGKFATLLSTGVYYTAYAHSCKTQTRGYPIQTLNAGSSTALGDRTGIPLTAEDSEAWGEFAQAKSPYAFDSIEWEFSTEQLQALNAPHAMSAITQLMTAHAAVRTAVQTRDSIAGIEASGTASSHGGGDLMPEAQKEATKGQNQRSTGANLIGGLRRNSWTAAKTTYSG